MAGRLNHVKLFVGPAKEVAAAQYAAVCDMLDGCVTAIAVFHRKSYPVHHFCQLHEMAQMNKE